MEKYTKRLIVYISGPISKGNLAANINQGTAAFLRLVKAGLAPICTMWSVYAKECLEFTSSAMFNLPVKVMCQATVTGNDQMSHADWMGVDLTFVEVSNCILRLPGESVGADAEVAHAKSLGIPVFYTETELLQWAAERAVEDREAKFEDRE